MIWYILLGLAWAGFLEYYSTKYLSLEETGGPWTWRERLFHTMLWFFSFGIFLWAVAAEWLDRRKDEE